MGFTKLPIALRYRSDSHDFPKDFLIPVLKESRIYKRAVGYFSTSALIELSYGLFEFAEKGGRIQLICSPQLDEQDIDAIKRKTYFACLRNKRKKQDAGKSLVCDIKGKNEQKRGGKEGSMFEK